jgi:xylulokinase
MVMLGFAAPKLKSAERHEPDIFERTSRVLLPKDHVLRLMTGDALSDAASTLWLDGARHTWPDVMPEATFLIRAHMPRFVQGSEAHGTLRSAPHRRSRTASSRTRGAVTCWQHDTHSSSACT